MAADANTINTQLFANTKDFANKATIANAQLKAQEVDIANTVTVIGQGQALQTVNGFVNIDGAGRTENDPNFDAESISTVAIISQITPSATVYPTTDPNNFNVDVSAGTFSVVNTVTQVATFVMDSAGGEPIEDINGDLVTELVDVSTSAVVSSVGTGVASTVNQTISSLTGIVPPTESISIVALGGAAINELTSAITVASERKSSLLSDISSVAGATSVEGLGSSVQSGLDEIQNKLDETVNSNTLTQDVLGAVSAVSNLANDAAQQVATATGSIINTISQTVNEVASNIVDGVGSSLMDVVDQATDALNLQILPAVNTGGGFLQDLFEDLTGSAADILQSAIAGEGLNKNIVSTIIKDVLAGGDINITNAMRTLTLQDTSLSPQMRAIVSSVDNAKTPAEFQSRVSQRASAANIPAEQITAFNSSVTNVESALSKIDTTIAGTIVVEVGDFYVEKTVFADLAKRYLRADTKEFPYVDSKEELGLEFKNIKRPISEVIIHASETHTNANIGAEELHIRHNEAGHNGIQYHYVIRRDGRLQRGVPLDLTTVASDVRGHARNCIDVVLVGGVNVPTEDDGSLENLSSQSFTQTQMKTLEALLETFYQYMPGGQVLGHNAIDGGVEDPYFDVIAFVENKFGKKSVYSNPLTESSYSASDLVNKRQV